MKKLKLTSKPITETQIKHQVKDYLALKGYYSFHLLAGMGAFKGAPDRIAISKDGQVYFIEVKKPVGSVQSEWQVKFQQEVEKRGGRYLLVKKLEDLILGLKEEK